MNCLHHIRNQSHRRFGAGLSAAGLVLALSGSAGAQSLDREFEEGFELNPIEPTPAGDRFFLVPDGFSDPDAPEGAGPVRGMLFLHYSLAPSLTRTDNETGETADIVQNQLYAHANITGYVTPWLLLNADLPFAVVQEGEGPLAPASAVGDLRVGARFGVYGKRSSSFAVSPGLDLWLPTGSPENLTGDEKTRAEPYVSIGGQAGVFVYAAKWGVQFRNAVYTGSLELGTSMTYGASVGLSLFDNILQVGPELAGKSLISSEANNAFSGPGSPMTGMLGARAQIGVINVGAGFGVGLTEAPGTAPRAILSVSYNPIQRKKVAAPLHPPEQQTEEEGFVAEPTPTVVGPVDSDGDNIFDDEDACPDKMGEANDDPSEHGCPYVQAAAPEPEPIPAPKPEVTPVTEITPVTPAPAPAPTQGPDADGDGVPDGQDACPKIVGIARPENLSRHGCPASQAKEPPPKPAPIASIHEAPKGPPTATWVGFRQLSPTKTLVYVNLTETVAVRSETQGNRLIFTLSGTRVAVRNNRNPLLASHFGTAVKSAQLLPKGKDVELVIELNGAATPHSRVVRETQGATLRVELEHPPREEKQSE